MQALGALPLSQLRNVVRAQAGQRFGNSTVTVASTGEQVIIAPAGIKHATSADTPMREQLLSILQTPQPLQSAEKVRTEPDRKRRPDILAIHVYRNRVTVGDRAYGVELFVREHRDGRRFYDQALLDDAQRESPGSQTGATPGALGSQTIPGASGTIIDSPTAQVNQNPADAAPQQPAAPTPAAAPPRPARKAGKPEQASDLNEAGLEDVRIDDDPFADVREPPAGPTARFSESREAAQPAAAPASAAAPARRVIGRAAGQTLVEVPADGHVEETIQQMAARRGARVIFATGQDGRKLARLGGLTLPDGTIVLAAGDSAAALNRFLNHEWVHFLAQADPRAYDQLVEALPAELVEASRRRYAQLAEAQGINAPADREEGVAVVGEVVADLLADPARLAELRSIVQPSVWTRIRRAIASVIRLFRRQANAGGTDPATARMLLQAAEAFERAIVAAEARGGRAYTPAARERARAALRAWHGTPHDFERFDSRKIGTGEGHQAFGYGLYFASKREVAEHYRDQLSHGRGNRPTNVARRILDAVGGDREKAIAEAEARLRASGQLGIDQWQKLQAEFDSLVDQNDRLAAPNPALTRRIDRLYDRLQDRNLPEALELLRSGQPLEGRIYEVELAPSEDELLDWDTPLAKQSEKVKQAISTLPGRSFRDNHSTGADIHRSLFHNSRVADPQETEAVRSRQVSAALRASGIRGIRYLDAGSRGGEEGSHNYVIFDDADVNIVGRFAIRSGKQLREIEHQLPRLPIRGRRLNSQYTVSDDDLRGRALDAFDRWPDVVRDREGAAISVAHIKQGTSDALFEHLTTDSSGRFDRTRASWLPLIPATIAEARVKLYDPKNRSWVYVAKYEGDWRHLVVVQPDGAIQSQSTIPQDGDLWTHFSQSLRSRGRYTELEGYWLNERPASVAGSEDARRIGETSPDKSTPTDPSARAEAQATDQSIDQPPPEGKQNPPDRQADPDIRHAIRDPAHEQAEEQARDRPGGSGPTKPARNLSTRPASWAASPAQTPQGRTLLRQIQRDPQGRKAGPRAWYQPTRDDPDSAVAGTPQLMKADEDRLMFYRYNYCKLRLSRLQRAIKRDGLTRDLADQFVEWQPGE